MYFVYILYCIPTLVYIEHNSYCPYMLDLCTRMYRLYIELYNICVGTRHNIIYKSIKSFRYRKANEK